MDYLKYFNLGTMFMAPALVGLFLGAWIDKSCGMSPLFTVLLIMIGILTGFWSVYKTVNDLK
jgi:F0F1-type ATP synthase assembly protein I